MLFGSEEIFGLICDNLNDPHGEDWCMQVFNAISHDGKIILSSSRWKPSSDDIEDIIQESAIKVFNKLAKFCLNQNSSTEGQRDSWLRTIIKNTEIDFMKARLRKKESSIEEQLEENEEGISRDFASNIPGVERLVIIKEDLKAAIAQVCALNTTVDKILTYILLKISSINYKIRGDATEVEEITNGSSYEAVYEVIVEQMKTVMTYIGYSDDLLEPLAALIQGSEEQIIESSAAQITGSANDLKDAMRRKREGHG